MFLMSCVKFLRKQKFALYKSEYDNNDLLTLMVKQLSQK